MNSREIRSKFLEFFRERGHEVVPSAPLIPRDDPTLLFTNAGMVQFKRLYLGEETRSYKRAVTSQKCVRAGGKHNDLDQVGYTSRHHTFFEMLGNFSFGDYFKEKAVEWAWYLLTNIYSLKSDLLYVSVFENDEEAYDIWNKKIGLAANRIIKLGEKDNFWTMGDTGPCGPCSEIYYDQGASIGCGSPQCGPGCDCDRYLEIYNLVFTQFDRSSDGILSSLPKPNIDTGMGLERLASVVQGVLSNYDIDIIRALIAKTEELCGIAYTSNGNDKTDVAHRVISDHSRTIAFLLGDGVMPSNEGRGYVMRRIIRRGARFGRILGFNSPFIYKICDAVVDIMSKDYKELEQARGLIRGVVENEERRFSDTLSYGLKVLEDVIAELKVSRSSVISGETAFKLYDTYGLSPDIIIDVARDEAMTVDMTSYKEAMGRQRLQSQSNWKGSGETSLPEVYFNIISRNVPYTFVGYESTASKTNVAAIICNGKEKDKAEPGPDTIEVILDNSPFYGRSGGQEGDTGKISGEDFYFSVKETIKVNNNLIVHKGQLERGALSIGAPVFAQVDESLRKTTMRNHSATHILQAVLREILGDHVKQAGSYVSSSRLRFDFSHFTQLTTDQLREIELQVNRSIFANLPVETKIMNLDEAMESGAMAIFEESYGNEVRVLSIGDVSKELCGGTHVRYTGEIGLFRIVSESSVAANVRRIEAVTGETAIFYDLRQEDILKQAAGLFKTSPEGLIDKIERLQKEIKNKEKEISDLQKKMLTGAQEDLLSGLKEVNGLKTVIRKVNVTTPLELRETADRIKDKLESGIVILGAESEGKAMFICTISKDITSKIKAGDIIRELSAIVGGKGGGRPDMAQGGGPNADKIIDALNTADDILEKF